MVRSNSSKILHIAMAVLLVLWMTGAGCLFGCERGLATAQTKESVASNFKTVVSGDACASHGPSCCARHSAHKHATLAEKRTSSIESSEQQKLLLSDSDASGPVGNCPLSVNALAVVTKVRHEKTVAARTPVVELFTSSNQNRSSLIPIAVRPANRGDTYLRCCSFLI
jgi:hypothetical protein